MPSEFVKEVADVFAKDGPLSKVTANYTPRPSQIEFATSVAEALEQGKSLVAEAGTGTGKTFAYLVPALLKDQKVLISTAGKTLQDQLFTKDIPALLKALGMGCRVALLKGRSNYICKQRLEHALQEDSYVAKSREEVVHLHRIKKFAGQSVTGERGDITDVPENSGIWPEVTSTGENCLGANCDHYNDCFVMQAREKAKEAQLLVINHHLFLADISLKDNQITDFLPEFDLVVLDEAHQLTNIATNFFSQTLNLYDVRNLAADAVSQGYGVNKQIDWNGIYKTISNACDDLISTTHNILNSKDKQLAVAKFKDKHLLVEPFKKLFNQGMITGKNGIKMSKSKGNVISPDDLVRDYGCDSLRMYELFVGPPELDAEWDDRGIEGVYRFLSRFWNLVMDNKDKNIKASKEMIKARHKMIHMITTRLEGFSLNTVISGFMECNNNLIAIAKKEGGMDKETLEAAVLLLAPFAPHMGEELWEELGHTDSVFHHEWPAHDEEAMKDDEVEIPVQVNGKTKAVISIPVDISKEDAIAKAKEVLGDKLSGNIIKEIYVPKKIVNIVAK